MQRSVRTDVVVVGARAAGAATAMLLARAGLDVTVVDRTREGSDTLSTHALMRGAVIQLHRWGLLDDVVAAGTPAVRRTTFHAAAGKNVVDIKPGHGIDALYAPRRTVLDPLLVDAARSAGAKVHFGFTVRQLLRDRGGRVVGVLGADRLGRTSAIHARYVVGADGFNSVVAREVFPSVDKVGTWAGNYQYRYWEGVELDGYHWAFRPDVSAGAIPTNDGLTCVFVGADADRISSRHPEMYGSLLHAASPEMAERILAGRQVGPARRFIGTPGRVLQPWGPGWVLVGDAGYWKDPISAHGITDALRDAELAATAIAQSLDAPKCVETTAMQTFHDTRNRLSHDLFDVTDRMAAPNLTDEEIPTLLIAMSTSMADEVRYLADLDTGLWTPTSLIGATA
jgi:flavin-dependent dehydrogenase